MNNFVILGPINRHSAVCGTVFRDAYDGAIANARYLNIGLLFSRFRILYHAFTNRKLRRALRDFPRVRALFERMAKRALDATQEPRFDKLDAVLSKDAPNTLIFVPGTHLQLLPASAIDALKRERPQCLLTFYLIDGLDRTAQMCKMTVEEVLDYLRHFDAAFTYDRTDAAAHPELLRFIDIPLWRAPLRTDAAPSSLYFCGRNKKRNELLLSIHRRLADAGLRFRLEIIAWRIPGYAHPDVVSCSWVPYERYIQEALASNCLLEVLASDNNESTLRYKEAVIYNKKLLTTNPNIAGLPYYDPRWMRVFRTAEDIDLDWLRRVEPVDYGYRGDYSAETFLRRVEELTQGM